MSGVSNVRRRTKGSATKAPVSCPKIVKLYNNAMRGVNIIDQEKTAYRLNRKNKYHFYLRMFFDLINGPLVNSHIVCIKLGNGISLLNFKIFVAKALIDRYSNLSDCSPLTGELSKILMSHLY